jgi:hypothetical protein
MKPAIRVDNLSKRYRLGSRTAVSYRAWRATISDSVAGAWHQRPAINLPPLTANS